VPVCCPSAPFSFACASWFSAAHQLWPILPFFVQLHTVYTYTLPGCIFEHTRTNVVAVWMVSRATCDRTQSSSRRQSRPTRRPRILIYSLRSVSVPHNTLPATTRYHRKREQERERLSHSLSLSLSLTDMYTHTQIHTNTNSHTKFLAFSLSFKSHTHVHTHSRTNTHTHTH